MSYRLPCSYCKRNTGYERNCPGYLQHLKTCRDEIAIKKWETALAAERAARTKAELKQSVSVQPLCPVAVSTDKFHLGRDDDLMNKELRRIKKAWMVEHDARIKAELLANIGEVEFHVYEKNTFTDDVFKFVRKMPSEAAVGFLELLHTKHGFDNHLSTTLFDYCGARTFLRDVAGAILEKIADDLDFGLYPDSDLKQIVDQIVLYKDIIRTGGIPLFITAT